MPQLYYSSPKWVEAIHNKAKSIIKMSCKPHLINTLIKESQAGVFVTDKRALLYEPAEHLSLDHERVKPLMGAVSALQEAYEKLCKHKHDMWALIWDYKTLRPLIKQFRNVYGVNAQTSPTFTGNEYCGIISCSPLRCLHKSTQMCRDVVLLIMAVSPTCHASLISTEA